MLLCILLCYYQDRKADRSLKRSEVFGLWVVRNRKEKDMNYRIYNNNSTEWVLLIHGLGGSINTWKYQIKDLKDYNVLAVDLEGHGGSSIKRARHLLVRSAIDINDILVKENIEKVNIISLSLGTLVAMEFVYLYKEKVNSISHPTLPQHERDAALRR